MSYYFSKKIKGTFNHVLEKVTATLKAEGFGVLTEIDVKETLKALRNRTNWVRITDSFIFVKRYGHVCRVEVRCHEISMETEEEIQEEFIPGELSP